MLIDAAYALSGPVPYPLLDDFDAEARTGIVVGACLGVPLLHVLSRGLLSLRLWVFLTTTHARHLGLRVHKKSCTSKGPSFLGANRKKNCTPCRRSRSGSSLPTAFMLITVWEGADDEEARWGDCTLVDAVRELEDAPILTQLVDAAAKGSNGMWRVQVDLTGRFPEQEDSRFRLGGRDISDDDVDNEINEIYITVKHLSQPCRIVGQLVVRNEM